MGGEKNMERVTLLFCIVFSRYHVEALLGMEEVLGEHSYRAFHDSFKDVRAVDEVGTLEIRGYIIRRQPYQPPNGNLPPPPFPFIP